MRSSQDIMQNLLQVDKNIERCQFAQDQIAEHIKTLKLQRQQLVAGLSMSTKISQLELPHSHIESGLFPRIVKSAPTPDFRFTCHPIFVALSNEQYKAALQLVDQSSIHAVYENAFARDLAQIENKEGYVLAFQHRATPLSVAIRLLGGSNKERDREYLTNIILKMLRVGADVQAKDWLGYTALDWAVRFKKTLFLVPYLKGERSLADFKDSEPRQLAPHHRQFQPQPVRTEVPHLPSIERRPQRF